MYTSFVLIYLLIAVSHAALVTYNTIRNGDINKKSSFLDKLTFGFYVLVSGAAWPFFFLYYVILGIYFVIADIFNIMS